jgi:hypothetical protein
MFSEFGKLRKWESSQLDDSFHALIAVSRVSVGASLVRLTFRVGAGGTPILLGAAGWAGHSWKRLARKKPRGQVSLPPLRFLQLSTNCLL